MKTKAYMNSRKLKLTVRSMLSYIKNNIDCILQGISLTICTVTVGLDQRKGKALSLAVKAQCTGPVSVV